MYQAFFGTAAGTQLVVLAVVCFYLGNKSRKRSSLAKQKGMLVGVLATIALALEGWSQIGVELTEFLSGEIARICLMAITFVGISSLALEFIGHSFVWLDYCRKRAQSVAESRRHEREREHRDKERARLWESDRPEREQRERAAIARKRAEDAKLADKTKRQNIDIERRETARQKLLLFYHQHSPQIQDSISWDRFEDYTSHYLGDKVPAQQVEANAERMMETISSHFEAPEVPREYRTAGAIKLQYDREREQIQAAGYDARKTSAMIADLNFREDQALADERL